MVRRETCLDGRNFPGPWIIERHLFVPGGYRVGGAKYRPLILVIANCIVLGEFVACTRFTKAREVRVVKPGCEPSASLGVNCPTARCRPSFPDNFTTPRTRRRLGNKCGLGGNCNFACLVMYGIDVGEDVAALGRAVNPAVCVGRGIALIGSSRIVHIVRWSAPVPQ